MRKICSLLGLMLAVGCAGSDGKDGQDGDDGEPGATGPAGMDGRDGAQGKDGRPGAQGADGVDGAPGSDGADGASVRSGAGAPAAELGSAGDVYIDSSTGDLYAKGEDGWVKTGSLKGPAGDDGTDGVDVEDTLQGVRWFAFALNAAFVDTPSLLTAEAYTDTSSSASFTFTGANQQGRLAFQTAGSYLPSGIDLSAFESMDLSVAVGGGAVNGLALYMAEGTLKGCQWNLVPAAGPVYSVDLSDPSSCYDDSADGPFTLESVTMIQIGIVSNGANSRTLTVTNINLLDSK